MDLHEIDAHVEKHLPAIPEKGIPDLCVIYNAARPVIAFARALLFWRPKWQAVISAFMASLDAQCQLP